jgi:hypothetical protein
MKGEKEQKLKMTKKQQVFGGRVWSKIGGM